MVFEKETNLYQDAALASRFQTVDTQFNVVLGKISYLITDAEIAAYDDSHGTITNRMNSAENTVSGHTSQISSMQSSISGINSEITEFRSEVNSFEQTTNSTISSITSTISKKNRVWTSQPEPPYTSGDFWIRDNTLYVCTLTRNSGSYSAADWKPATKGKIFTSQPTVPYYAGDLWVQGENGEILKCITSRMNGSYSESDWTFASKYTDDSTFTNWETTTYNSFIQQLPNQINLQVTGSASQTAGQVFAAKASLIAEINSQTHESGIKISADRISLEGDTVINAINGGSAQINANRIVLTAYAQKSEVNTAIDELNNVVSVKNSVYRGDAVPTLYNSPASLWNTDAIKDQHVNDMYVRSNGDQYQFAKQTNGIIISFNSQSKTESVSYDYVQIFFKNNDRTYEVTKLGGTGIAGAKVFVPSNQFWLYWHSDSSVTDYGFKIDSITSGTGDIVTYPTGTIPSYTETSVSGSTYPETSHPYNSNENTLWKYTYSGSIPSASYGWVKCSDSVLTASINVLNNEISSKVSAGEIASSINQTAQSVRINADKINLDGYLTISSAKSTYSTDEQYIYYQQNSSTAPSAYTTWVTSTSDTYNTWTTRRPTYRTSYKYIFVAKQRKDGNGNVTCTTPYEDLTTTVIDGGNIITGTLTASQITTGKLKNTYGNTYFDLDNDKIVIGGSTHYTKPIMTLDYSRISFSANIQSGFTTNGCYIEATGGDAMYLTLHSDDIKLESKYDISLSAANGYYIYLYGDVKLVNHTLTVEPTGGSSYAGIHTGLPVTCGTARHIHFRINSTYLEFQYGTSDRWYRITSTPVD